METLVEIEAKTNALRNRALEILGEFRIHAESPDKVIELADELLAVISAYEAQVGALDRIQELAEALISKDCSGPH